MTDLIESHSERLEDSGADVPSLTHDPEKQVLRADMAVAELARLVDRQLDHLLGTRGQRDLAGRRRGVTASHQELHRRPSLGEIDAERVERPGGDALAFADQPEQEVLDPDVVVVEANCLVLGEGEHALGAVVEAIEGSHW